MRDDDTTSGDDAVSRLIAMAKPSLDVSLVMTHSVIIACAYCVQAMNADSAGQLNLAWTFVADGTWWAGRITGYRLGERDGDKWVSQRARSAALSRHKENRQMRCDVLEWMETNGKRYPSKDAAAEAIAGKVVPLKFRTVRNWLRDPPKK